ncbi:MAG: hypothetical protein HYR66_05975 [Sphingobacteriales bacterium]|nr:hypothetical protein [Sphingobacteriales bacterium]MBI3717887.1 hypothetical protein [Sphingobacteriales bacterium]
MQQIFLRLLILVSFASLFACNSSKKITGIYHSRFAVLGFFGTRVCLKTDSTFTYRMQGDLAYDTAAGKFIVQHKLVILNYKPLPIDTSQDYLNSKGTIDAHEAITGNKNLKEPLHYLIGHNKLFLTDKKGKKIKRQWGYSRKRKYYFFGSHEYNRRYYLKKIKSLHQ